MAEFCPECWNRINGRKDRPEKYIISKGLDLCEGCGEYKHVIVAMREYEYASYIHPNVRISIDFVKAIFYGIKIVIAFCTVHISVEKKANNRAGGSYKYVS